MGLLTLEDNTGVKMGEAFEWLEISQENCRLSKNDKKVCRIKIPKISFSVWS